MKRSALAAVICALPLTVAAEQTGPRNQLVSTAIGIASAHDPAAAAEDALAGFVLSSDWPVLISWELNVTVTHAQYAVPRW